MTFLRPAYIVSDTEANIELECLLTDEVVIDRPFRGTVGIIDQTGTPGLAYPSELRRTNTHA